MPGTRGNRNAAKGSEWRDALKWALENVELKGIARGQALRAIAQKTIELAIDGDRSAREEIANRLDGKPHQSMDIGHYDVPPEEMTDAELASIAASGRSRIAQKARGETEPTDVH